MRLLILVSLLAVAARADSRFFAEGGGSLVLVGTASLPTTPNFSVSRQSNDRTKGAPYISAGVSFSERFRLRLSYHYIADLESTQTTTWAGGPTFAPEYDFHIRSSDDVHIVGLAPELIWPVSQRVSLSVSPVLNWVASRGALHFSTNAPNISIIPRIDHRDDDFTFGGAVGLTWALAERMDAVFSYQYTDLKPSFGRTAQLLSAGLRWRF